MALLVMLAVSADGKSKKKQQPSLFPDGTPIPAWFSDTTRVDMNQLGKQYVITDYGVRADDSTLVQTEAIQAVIDRAASEGGGVIVVPRGTFLSGSLFFRQGTHLQIREGGKLKGPHHRLCGVFENCVEGSIRFLCPSSRPGKCALS